MPRPCVLGKGGYDAACRMWLNRPSGLQRTYGVHHLHFITCPCDRRLPFLRTARSRDRFFRFWNRVASATGDRAVLGRHFRFPPLQRTQGRGTHRVGDANEVKAWATRPEPEVGTPSTVMQVLKQRTGRALLPKKKRADTWQRRLFGEERVRAPFWQARFYDFNVWTARKRVEKLRYMHRNPVKRGLVSSPEE